MWHCRRSSRASASRRLICNGLSTLTRSRSPASCSSGDGLRIAPDSTVLIAARAAQGLAGALMAASSLAIITSSFEAGPQLHRAIGTWAAMNGLGGAAGTLFGEIITQYLSWRWVLLINPPIALAAGLVAYAVVSDRRRVGASRGFDLPGALTLTLGQMLVVYGVVEAGL